MTKSLLHEPSELLTVSSAACSTYAGVLDRQVDEAEALAWMTLSAHAFQPWLGHAFGPTTACEDVACDLAATVRKMSSLTRTAFRLTCRLGRRVWPRERSHHLHLCMEITSGRVSQRL